MKDLKSKPTTAILKRTLVKSIKLIGGRDLMFRLQSDTRIVYEFVFVANEGVRS